MFYLHKDLQEGLSAPYLFSQRREKVPIPEFTFTFHMALYWAKDIYQAPSYCLVFKVVFSRSKGGKLFTVVKFVEKSCRFLNFTKHGHLLFTTYTSPQISSPAPPPWWQEWFKDPPLLLQAQPQAVDMVRVCSI